MRSLRIAALLTVGLFVGCVAFAHPDPDPGPRYYLSKPAYSFSDTTAERVTVYVDEKLQIRINSLLLVGRLEQKEQAACLRVAARKGSAYWLDSMLTAYIVPNSATRDQITFGCDRSQVPLHVHVVQDEYECAASGFDTGPAWSIYPLEMVTCGIGIDSLIAWKARPIGQR